MTQELLLLDSGSEWAAYVPPMRAQFSRLHSLLPPCWLLSTSHLPHSDIDSLLLAKVCQSYLQLRVEVQTATIAHLRTAALEMRSTSC